jgi:O-antigen ligase
MVGLTGLGTLQLVPIPDSLHRVLAPGSAELWHPADPVAALVLGFGLRPISVLPFATADAIVLSAGVAVVALTAVEPLRARALASRAVIAVVSAGLLVALYALVARLLFGNLLYGSLSVPTTAPFGPFVNKNHFAGYVEMASLLAFGLSLGLKDAGRRGDSMLGWLEGRHAARAVAAGGAAAAMALSVLVSQSRGGVLSLVAGFAALVAIRTWKRRPHRVRLGVTVAAILLTGLAALAVLPQTSRDRLTTLAGISRDPAGAYRLSVWRDALAMSIDSPVVGYGLGAFADAFPPWRTRGGDFSVQHVECDYLEVLIESGVAGLGLVLAFLSLSLRAILVGLQRQQDPIVRGLGLGATAGIVALLVHSLFDFNLRIPSNALLFAFLGAVALGAARVDTSSWRPRAVATGLVALFVIGVSYPRVHGPIPDARRDTGSPLRAALMEASLRSHLLARPADAEAWLLLGYVRARSGRLTEGAELARYAARLDPLRLPLRREAERLARTPRAAP